VIVAHLGSGASLCALRDGRSVDSSFGFTALDGLCMGTRPGALDPGVVLYLFQGSGCPPRGGGAALQEVGPAGHLGHQQRHARPARERRARGRLAVDYFVYQAAKEIGALAAVLGGLDGLVFTAGIGENSAEIRRRICEASAWLGVELDAAANDRGGPASRRPGAGSRPGWSRPTRS
jgi:acetate kinase